MSHKRRKVSYPSLKYLQTCQNAEWELRGSHGEFQNNTFIAHSNYARINIYIDMIFLCRYIYVNFIYLLGLYCGFHFPFLIKTIFEVYFMTIKQYIIWVSGSLEYDIFCSFTQPGRHCSVSFRRYLMGTQEKDLDT